jgi:cation:H+ antiporter
VALGTSLPELVTSSIAAYKKQTDLAMGNLLGSNIFNILSILGITSMIKNINVDPMIVDYDMLWMLGITVLVLPLAMWRRKLGKVEGIILLIAYVSYIYTVIV